MLLNLDLHSALLGMDMIGKYRVMRPLGKGATATVYLCLDADANREVAVKLINLGDKDSPMTRRLRKLFQTEMTVARALDHPNIVKVFDAVVEENRAYLVMEYIKGKPLDQHVRFDALLPMHRVIGIVFKCCMALDYAYKQGVIHRDLKPANIMLDEDDNPKITDFGLAQFLGAKNERDSTYVTGVGSPAYMSPEQIKAYPLNQKTDLYSMGVVLFQLLTGRLPYRAPNQAALMYKIINGEIPTVTGLNPSLPEGLDNIVRKALEKDLFSRYNNGADFAKDLTAVRYQLVDENTEERDLERFNALRKIPFFDTFEDIELWESIRLCGWREVAEKVVLMQEGEEDRRFGILVKGYVEVSVGGKALCRLGAGECVGEMSYLHPQRGTRSATVVTLEPTTYLEISPAALSLASEEVQQRFQGVLIGKVIDRVVAVDRLLAQHGETAVQPSSGLGELDLQLAPIEFH